MGQDPKKTGRRTFLLGGAATLLAPAGQLLAAATVVGPIRSVRDYSKALSLSRLRNEYALVDVAADWCAFCKTIDGEILVHPRIVAMMARFALLKIDVTDWTADNVELLGHLDVQGPPTVFIAETTSGIEMSGTRTVGNFDVDNLSARLSSVG